MFIGIAFYLEPLSAIKSIIFLLCSTKKKNPSAVIISFKTILILLVASGSDFNEQWTNIKNQFNLQDPESNMFLLFLSQFLSYETSLSLLKSAYFITILVLIIKVKTIVRKGYAIIALCS